MVQVCIIGTVYYSEWSNMKPTQYLLRHHEAALFLNTAPTVMFTSLCVVSLTLLWCSARFAV